MDATILSNRLLDFADSVLTVVDAFPKAAREAYYWVRLARRRALIGESEAQRIVGEANELTALLTASARTAKKRAG